MAAVIYFLCALTAFVCFALLWRGWSKSGVPLLFWSALCFAGLTISNVLLVADKLVFPNVDLYPPRLFVTISALLLLIFGLVWGDDR